MKKLIILLIGCIILCCLFCSCEYEEPITNKQVESIKEEKKVIIPSELIGNYKEHYGEINKGNIIITDETINIQTDMLSYEFICGDDSIIIDNCYLILELPDGKVLKITNWIKQGRNIITLHLEDFGVKYFLGNFDIIKEKI